MTLTPRYSPSGPVLPLPAGGTFDPIFHQYYLDTTKPGGGNGSIGTPLNTWADAVNAFATVGTANATLVFVAQTIDASGTPIPNLGAAAHEVPTLKLQGAVQSRADFASDINVTGLVVQAQDGDDFGLSLEDINLVGASFPAGCILNLTGENAILSTFSQAGASVFGFSNLIECSINAFVLPAFNLRMQGGTVDTEVSVDIANLDGVTFRSGAQFRYATSMFLTNCRFEAGAQILVSANQPLTLDLDTWGAMIAAGVTFPDTTPVLTIVPPPARVITIVPTLGTLSSGPAYTSFTINSGTIPALAGLAVGDSVTVGMRNDHDADGYSLVQASVRAADSITLTFLKVDVGTIDVGIVTLEVGIIEAP